jgi:DNA-binding CsgD family transcriptional regulator/tetratricopeptide (TPR) repeat protein
VLAGRSAECATLDRLLVAARAGQSQVLVLRGEAGFGKTALLEYLSERAAGCSLARAAGVESEMELAFAGLQQLCAPMLDRLEQLPGPQRDALGTAFGLRTGEPPDRFLVGLAVLSLLAEVAEEEPPLVCLVDDAQWLDRVSAQTLAFVARRLLAERVGLVFAVRAVSDEHEFAGLPEQVVGGLSDGDARALLDSEIAGRLDERVRDRIVAETRGNPLALLELPRGLTPAELAGGFALPDASPLASQIEESFLRQLQPLPVETRRLLITAAAEPVGDVTLLWRAVERLGIGADAAAPAEAAGLIEFGARVRFRHPLLRSAAYRAAGVSDLQEVHRALADVTDPDLDPDRRAWHRAHAAVGPDEEVAAELERSAGRAQARGGLAAAAAFLERATMLTIEPAHRAQRALVAAQAKHQAGAPDAALELLATAKAGPLDELGRARVELLRAQIAFAVSHGGDVPALLVRAAKQLEPLEVTLARETYLDALSAAMLAGRLASGYGLLEVAQAARAAPAPLQTPRGPDLLLDGLALVITVGYRAGVPTLKRALTAFRGDHVTTEEELRWLWFAGQTALELWDDEAWEVFATRQVQVAREVGALPVLALALNSRIGVHMGAGEFTAAEALLLELEAIVEATGSQFTPYVGLALAALQGREAEVSRLTETTMREVLSRGEGLGLAVIQWSAAVLYNGLGHYAKAVAATLPASELPRELWFSSYGSVELVEAAVRSGDRDVAARALGVISETTSPSGTEFALGMEARSRALLSEGDDAEGLYRNAIERLGHTRIHVELARAHLLYGEWLRRERRRLDAREHLRTAHDQFIAMGMAAFGERAARELRATGETARRRSVETSGQLTAQEAQIARLARDGLSNPEIGARLFISPRTVEYHLHKVFTKLRIGSRIQLDGALPSEPRLAQPV